jgi:hypothetical protein
MIPLLAGEMVNPTRSRVKKMVFGTLVFVGLFSYVVPCLGYLLFIDDEVVSCFFIYLEPEGAPEVIVGMICMVVIAVCSNMFSAFISCNAILSIFKVDINEEGVSLPRLFVTGMAVLISICFNFAGDLGFEVFYEVSTFAFLREILAISCKRK